MDLPRTPSFRLDGRRALVTGASSGIGLGCAVALAEAGAHVVCAARGEARLSEAVAAMQAAGYSAEALVLDISGRALDHVLINLIENAIKYAGDMGKVRVTATGNAEAVQLEVRDWGPGIPRKYQERIFERFYRVDKGRSRAEGGTGLGLAIVRHLVGRMGGSVAVESEPGEGARFRVSVPVYSESDEVDGVDAD